jgi:hypothetical protein
MKWRLGMYQREHTGDLMLEVAEKAFLQGDIGFRDCLIIRRWAT